MTFDDFLEEWQRDDIDFITARTSGSTGIPKEIRLPKSFVRRSAEATNSFFGLAKGSRFHSCVAADFIGGKMMLVRAELAGGVFSWEIPSNRPLLEMDRDDAIDLLAVVPSQMIHILDNSGRLPVIRNIIIGGSSIHPDLRGRIAESGLVCYETYGMTETSSHIALRRILLGKPEPFRTIGGVKVSTDSRGCLVISFTSGEKVVTNDLGEVLSSSEFYILGRVDDVIVTGGKKLNPAELETQLSCLSGEEVYISSLPDSKWGERVVAAVSGETQRISLCNVIADAPIPAWKKPKDVLVVSSLPLTSNGKIDRKELRRIIREKVYG